MSHSLHKIWIHAVWATKYRAQLIHPNIENQIFKFIEEQLREQGCPVRIINGMADHIHCLFLLSPEKSIADVMKQVKGSSTHFVNKNNLIQGKFAWQTGYAAFSVSQSGVERVYKYIKNQKAHHQKRVFKEEYEAFLKLHDLVDKPPIVGE